MGWVDASGRTIATTPISDNVTLLGARGTPHAARMDQTGRRGPAWTRLGTLLAASMFLAGSGCTAVLAPAALVATPASGIGAAIGYNDQIDRLVVGWRNLVWSKQAWRARGGQYGGNPYFKDFGHGFRQGYRDVASGSNGCPPALPPRRYWSWKYQTPEGQAKVAAWFSGYPNGARAAEEDRAADYSQIQVSYVIEAEYGARCPGGCAGPQGTPPRDGTPAYPTPRSDGTWEVLPPGPAPVGPQHLPPTSQKVYEPASTTALFPQKPQTLPLPGSATGQRGSVTQPSQAPVNSTRRAPEPNVEQSPQPVPTPRRDGAQPPGPLKTDDRLMGWPERLPDIGAIHTTQFHRVSR